MDSPDQPKRNILRAKLTGFRLFTTCILGCLLGFVPGFINPDNLREGFYQAPGLILAILAVALIVKCNLILFAITVAASKLLALQAVGVAFSIGEFLLDGPISGLFELMINAPLLAWFGLEYYATSGGLVLGAITGIITAMVFRRFLRTSVPVEVAENQKLGLPVRLSGVIAVILMAGAAWVLQIALSSSALKGSVKDGLEYGNGATVDLAGLDLSLLNARVGIDGVAMADASRLGFDLFRASKLTLQIETGALLRRRLVIKNVIADTAATGVKRASPGQRVGEAPPPPPPDPKAGDRTLQDYLEQAELWEQRLRQADHWITTIFRSPTEESEQDRDIRIAEERKTLGPAAVAASHLITGSPLVTIEKLTLTGIAMGDDQADSIDIIAHNLSTDPSLLAEPAAISIKSKKNTFGLELKLDATGSGASGSLFHNALGVDAIVAQLKKGGSKTIQGGTMKISLGGAFQFRGDQGLWLDLPLTVALQNTTLSIKGMKPASLDKLELPLGLHGPLSSPRIRFDDSKLADALVAAGRAELAKEVKRQADKLLGDNIPDNLKGSVGDILTGKGEDAVKKATEQAAAEAKKKAEAELQKKAEEALKKNLPGGLFGGKKKKE